MAERQLIDHRPPIKYEHIDMYRSVGLRIAEAHRVYEEHPFAQVWQQMQPEDWYQLDEEGYARVDDFTTQLYESTRHVYSDGVDEEQKHAFRLNVDYPGVRQHIDIMQGMCDRYWEQEEFRSLFPAGTTSQYPKVLALVHDFSRFEGINGEVALNKVDDISAVELKQFFPGMPTEEHLHHIGWMTGTKAPPGYGENPIAQFFKLIDTCGKNPPRFPHELFATGGPYDTWIEQQKQKQSLPLYAIEPTESYGRNIYEVNADYYREHDIEVTLQAYELIQTLFPGVDFESTLRDVVAQVTQQS